MAGKKVGELNGPWAILFRINMSMILPALMSIGGIFWWGVKHIHQLEVNQAIIMNSSFDKFEGEKVRSDIKANKTSIDSLTKVENLLYALDIKVTRYMASHESVQ